MIEITDENIIKFYGNKVGYIKENTAFVDPMFERNELAEFLNKYFSIKWQDGIYDILISNEPIDAINLKNCKIHQLKSDVDFRMKFIGYDSLIMKGLGKPKLENYVNVFNGNAGTNDLDAIYSKFSEAGEIRALSMSDIIELYDENESVFYYVDEIGFKEISFNQKTEEIQNIEETNEFEETSDENMEESFTFVM